MRLGETEMRRILPSVIRGDPYHVALSEVVDGVADEVWARSRLLTIWDRIDELPESHLDRLARALHVEWYETGAPIEVKRSLIRESDLVHARKGTVAAVESVIRSYFGDGFLMEWFDYGGQPHHFKAFTTNASAVYDNLERFNDLLAKVKRHSSKLDAVMVGLTGLEELTQRTGYHDYAEERHRMVDPTLPVHPTVGTYQRESITVRMTALPRED